MITNVKLHESTIEIERDNFQIKTILLSGMMTPPFKLEHWDGEKIVIVANEEYKHILDEYGNFISSEII